MGDNLTCKVEGKKAIWIDLHLRIGTMGQAFSSSFFSSIENLACVLSKYGNVFIFSWEIRKKHVIGEKRAHRELWEMKIDNDHAVRLGR